jgi:hypothetical protein
MADGAVFTRIKPELVRVVEQLREYVPIFHRATFGKDVAVFRRAMAPEYWEGARQVSHPAGISSCESW